MSATRRGWIVFYVLFVALASVLAYVGIRAEDTRDRTVVLERQSACLEDENSAECAASVTAAIKRCVSEERCSDLLRSVIRQASEPRAGGFTKNGKSPISEENTASDPSSSSAPQGSTPAEEGAPPADVPDGGGDAPEPPTAPPANPSPPERPPVNPPSNPPDRGLGETVEDVTDAVCSVNAAGLRICL